MRSDPKCSPIARSFTILICTRVTALKAQSVENVLNAPRRRAPKLLDMDSWGQSWVSACRPVRLLFLLYVCWKAILFVVILCSPGPGYDTSTALLDLTDSKPNHQIGLLSSSPTLSSSLLKLVRWDAIYYSQLSHRGHVFEQEWAFGVGLSGAVSFISTCKRMLAPAIHFTN
jgi:Mannosyltransferase (PIG-V)